MGNTANAVNTAKVVLVTGSGRGIGRGIALEFARQGYDVAIHHRKEPEGSERVAQEIRNIGRKEEILAGELSDKETPVRIVNETYERMGRLDVLVNNAGITVRKPFLEMELERLEQCYRVDFLAAYLCAQRAAQRMVETGTKGVIINFTSVHQERTNDGWQEHAETIQKAIPAGRAGNVEDVARAVAFLASDQAEYITGITLRVDGGMNLPMMRALLEGRQIFI